MKPADGNLSNKQILCYGNIFVKPDESKEKRDQQYALRQKIKELNTDEDTGIYRIKSLKHELSDCLNIFATNTRSVKAKTEELSYETYQHGVVCLTEAQLGQRVLNHQIFDYNTKTIQKRIGICMVEES